MNHYTLFDGISNSALTELLKLSYEYNIPAGKRIIQEGEIVTSLFVLKSGTVEIRKLIDTREEIIHTLRDGDFFGENVIEDDREMCTASASAITTKDSTILRFDKGTVLAVLQRYPQILWNMAREVSKRVSRIEDTLRERIEEHHKDSKKEISRLNALIKATQMVNSSLDIDTVLHSILDEALQATNAERGTIYLVDESSNEIWSRTIVSGEKIEIRQPIGKGISGYVAQTGETVNSKYPYNDPRFNAEFDMKTGFKTKNILCVAMRNKDNRIIGVFQLINKRRDDFNSEDEMFLKAFSVHASIAIENSRLAVEMMKNERLSAVGKMAGTIVHDIKNPMSTIRLYAQVLKKKVGVEETSDLLDQIIKQIDRMVSMAQEVLDFSRGISQMNLQRVEYDQFLTDTLLFIDKDLKERGIELDNRNFYHGEIEIDPEKMTRVILNISSNASAAMPNGGKLFVRSIPENNFLILEFEDTGIGMPDEIKRRIFEPFVTFGKKHGTGLGMAIVKKIIDDHHGDIKIQSQVGKGTIISIRIPIVAHR